MRACARGNEDVARELLNAQASVLAVDNEGLTPLVTPTAATHAIVAENGKSITVSPSESVCHRSESVFEKVNRYRFTV